ncbi:MAG: glutamine--fructose-6-phosphate transaminase (isomerizing) [Minisyncoccia bacterium]
MCGIIAYKGKENAKEIIIKGLKHLEYRGYDSSGICLSLKNDLFLIKKVGKIDNLIEEIKEIEKQKDLISNAGIGHTRWATHGKVSEINAHPHFSCDKEIYVVHNGIIENYEKIKKELIKKGHKFVSETDTEIIPHLIEEYRKKFSFEKSCQKTFKELKGLFACVVLDKKTEEIVGARNGSPLVMGLKKEGLFLASDIPAFLDKTNKIILINDGEMVHFKNNRTFSIKNYLSNKEIKRKPLTINWSKEEAEKGRYPHFMLKEIMEAPEAINRAVLQDNKKMQKISEILKKAGRIVFVGCGTAGHACLYGKYLFSNLLKKNCDFIPASEFHHFLETFDKKTLVIAISQSGETIDVIEAVKKVKEREIKVLSLVNVMGSTLTRISDFVLMINAGPEKCVLATKSYLSQMSLLLLLAHSVLGRNKQVVKELKHLSLVAKKLLKEKEFLEKLKSIANLLKKEHHLYIIGRGFNYPTALETALKIKEGTYLHAEAFAGGELKHGVIALVEKNTPCFVHFAKDIEETNTLINAMELKSRGAYLIGFGYKSFKDFNKTIVLPEVKDIYSPLLNILPIYLISYYLAVLKGRDPDKPRNLAKSVTVK